MIERLLEARWPISLAFVGTLVVAWQIAVLTGALADYILAPTAIVAAFADELLGGALPEAVLASLLRALPGFAIGATLGVLAGLAAGVSRVAADLFDPPVSVTYPLPKIALFPIFVIWLGFSDTARILVISLSCFYPSFINALAGTKGIDSRMLWAARNFEASRLRRFFQVVLPASLPSVLVGLRISLALSFVLTFATETIGAAERGLGFVIQEAFNARQFDTMYAGILTFALLGFLADLILRRVAARSLHGQRLEAVGIG